MSEASQISIAPSASLGNSIPDPPRVALLAYVRDKYIIDLFIWPGNGAAPTNALHNGYNVIQWRADGMTFWAVSDLEAGQLRNFVQLWQAEG